MKCSFELGNSNGAIRGYRSESRRESLLGSVVCLHGGPGGDFRGNTDVFNQIADILPDLGYTTYQFSFYGAAPSDGEADDICLASQMTDYRSILQLVKSESNAPVHVIAESAGATVASLDWQPEIASYVLLWPAFDLRDTDLKPYLNLTWWEEIEQNGCLRDKQVVVGRKMFLDLLLTDFQRSFLLPAVETLIAHGIPDKEVPFEQSIRAVRSCTGPVSFLIHPDADHGFKSPSCRQFLLNAIKQWFEKR